MKQIAILIICFGLTKLIFGYPTPEPTMGQLLPLVESVLALAGTATASYYASPYYLGSLYYGGAPYYSGAPCYGSNNLAGYGTPGYGTPCYGPQYG